MLYEQIFASPVFWVLAALAVVIVGRYILKRGAAKKRAEIADVPDGPELLDEGLDTVETTAAGADTLLGAAPKPPTDDTSDTVADVVVPDPAKAPEPAAASTAAPAAAAGTPATTDAVVTKPEKVEQKPVAPAKVTDKVEAASKPVIDKPAAQRTEPVVDEPEVVTVVENEEELPAWLIPVIVVVAFLVVYGVFS